MNKEQLQNATIEGIMIAKVKEEIFRIIQNFKSDANLDENRIIEEINDISIEEFRHLSYSAHSESRYNKKMRHLVNKVLNNL